MTLPQNIALFAGIAPKELEQVLPCLNARVKSYAKGAVIALAGGFVAGVGVVLSGAVQVVKEDALGNRTILTKLGRGELFGEVFACAGVERYPVGVLSAADCEVLFIDYQKLVAPCRSGCAFHTALVSNLLRILAEKSLMLNQRIELLSKRTTREKLLAYFAAQSGSRFEIPFSRQALADFLCVDRSALSRELGKLRDEGRLRFQANKFELL